MKDIRKYVLALSYDNLYFWNTPFTAIKG